jgi:peptidoglycan/xylan/chitin deacetylase (PgdA/CDA1 family)
MSLVAFSIKTKGLPAFVRRLGTVFTRFGFSEARTRRALRSVVAVVRSHRAAPTFFIPAVVLRRHPALIAAIAQEGAEIGVHGYVHNDYRLLSVAEQRAHVAQATAVFREARVAWQGFRNPYLGWTDESTGVFSDLGFTYDSNEAVIHDVVDLTAFSPNTQASYAKSLALFQALPCGVATLRPHFEGALVRLPTSIPDDEMLFDRLRITDPREIGRIWTSVMRRVYDLGGLYVLNLHPERAVLCRDALESLLVAAHSQPLPVWVASLEEIAAWWRERRAWRLSVTAQVTGRWLVEGAGDPRATVLARRLLVEGGAATPWCGADARLESGPRAVRAPLRPCVALSPAAPQDVEDYLCEQGYPTMRAPAQDASSYAVYLDLPAGLGETREERWRRRADLLQSLEQAEAPLVRIGPWPDGARAALAITGDIDSVTIQDFFLRVLEVRGSARPAWWRAVSRPGWAGVPHRGGHNTHSRVQAPLSQ